MSDLEIKFLAFRVHRSADAKAFSRLHSLTFARISRFMYFKFRRPEDAAAMTNEVYMRAWEYMTTERVDNVTAFLYKVARNIIADYYRRAKPTEEFTSVLEAVTAAPGSFAKDLEVQEEIEAVMRVMEKLKPEYQEVLRMYYQDELSTEEIARSLGKTSNAVRVLLHRAKQALKKLV